MIDEIILYGQLSQTIQNVYYMDEWEQVLINLVDETIRQKSVSDDDAVSNMQITLLIDSIIEAEKRDGQAPITNMMLGKLREAL